MKRLPDRILLPRDAEVTRRAREGWKPFLRRVARAAGAFPCGGAGSCGRCAVQVLPPERAPDPDGDDSRLLGDDRVRQGWRLLCGLIRRADVQVPATALSAEAVDQRFGHIVDHYEVSGTGLENRRPGGGTRLGISTSRPAGRRWALAIDLGTTTVAGALVPLNPADGETGCVPVPPMFSDAVLNSQAEAGGPDVMSRIARASESPETMTDLTDRLRATVGLLTKRLLKTYGVSPDAVERAVLCGNTTMTYFYLGRDVACLGQYPFLPPDRGPFEAIGLFPGLRGPVRQWLFPTPGGFIGGDIVSGLLVTRAMAAGRPVLFMDLGTNGELVAVSGNRYYAAGTAAGPAFEGARIACGSPAVNGAIERVRLSRNRILLEVIGGGRPRSLCGSGLVDLTAELLRWGVLTLDGRLRDPGDPAVRCNPALAKRLYADEASGEVRFRVAGRRDSGVWLGQRDVREFQLAVAAIRAGIRLLLAHTGRLEEPLETVIIAGGYGFHLDVASARTVGLVPEGVPRDRVIRPGNAALAGAAAVAADSGLADAAVDLAGRCAVVNLADLPGFAEAFVEAMTFPDPRRVDEQASQVPSRDCR